MSLKYTFAAVIIAASASTAEARLLFTPKTDGQGYKQVVVSGEFEASDDVAAFVKTANASRSVFVTFDSPGGNVVKAMELGRAIRSLRMITVQPRNQDCASACALAFMGGILRYADPGSIGVHKSSFGDAKLETGAAVSAVQELTAETVSYMIDMGVDPALLQLSLRYDSDDIRYLSGSEMAQYRVTQREDEVTAKKLESQPNVASFRIEADGPTKPENWVGAVEWQLKDDGGIPYVQATLSFTTPSPMKAIVSFKKNQDASVPAASMVETTLDDSATAKLFDTIEPLAMKDHENDKGDLLIGVPAKITDDFFIFALNDYPGANQQNRRLLLERNVVEIPVNLRDGRRAYLDFSKGPTGQAAFSAAVEKW